MAENQKATMIAGSDRRTTPEEKATYIFSHFKQDALV